MKFLLTPLDLGKSRQRIVHRRHRIFEPESEQLVKQHAANVCVLERANSVE